MSVAQISRVSYKYYSTKGCPNGASVYRQRPTLEIVTEAQTIILSTSASELDGGMGSFLQSIPHIPYSSLKRAWVDAEKPKTAVQPLLL